MLWLKTTIHQWLHSCITNLVQNNAIGQLDW